MGPMCETARIIKIPKIPPSLISNKKMGHKRKGKVYIWEGKHLSMS